MSLSDKAEYEWLRQKGIRLRMYVPAFDGSVIVEADEPEFTALRDMCKTVLLDAAVKGGEWLVELITMEEWKIWIPDEADARCFTEWMNLKGNQFGQDACIEEPIQGGNWSVNFVPSVNMVLSWHEE